MPKYLRRVISVVQKNVRVHGENRKRIKKISDDHIYLMAYRTWRFKVQIDLINRHTKVLDLVSGYSPEELKSKADPYSDKKMHQLFLKTNFLD